MATPNPDTVTSERPLWRRLDGCNGSFSVIEGPAAIATSLRMLMRAGENLSEATGNLVAGNDIGTDSTSGPVARAGRARCQQHHRTGWQQ